MFFEILDFCVDKSTYFTFDDDIYKQKEGLVMGLSLAPTLADSYLTVLLEKCILKLSYKPKFFKKYVDDLISTAPADKVEETLWIFNSFDTRRRLKFTLEQEQNRKINFLDTTLIHMTDGRLITNWYHKKISSNTILSFLSNHLLSMKQNIITSFAKRVLSLSDSIFKVINYQRITEILSKIQYPITMIRKAIYTARNFVNDTNKGRMVQPTITQLKYRAIPYESTLTHQVQSQFQAVNPEIRTAPKAITKLRNFFS